MMKPGQDLVEKGLDDLAKDSETVESLLVQDAPLGYDIPECTGESPEPSSIPTPNRDDSDSAHSRYTALIRRLISLSAQPNKNDLVSPAVSNKQHNDNFCR